jgi:hypothetical protein
MSQKVDPRLGKTGEFEPKVCAVTGQKVQGRHAQTVHLRDGWYFRFLSKCNWVDVAKLRGELSAVIPGKPKLSKEGA